MVKINEFKTGTLSIKDAFNEYDLGGSVGLPIETEVSKKRFNEIKSGTISRINEGSTGDTLQPIKDVSIDHTTEEVLSFKIDMIDLWRMIYEHRRYSAARGFSDSELQVLKAIENVDKPRVTTKEIKQNEYVSRYSPGTIHRGLDNLEEKGLIKKHQRGLYSVLEV